MSTEYNYMIHRFDVSQVFGESEEYEEFTTYDACMKRLKWLDAREDGYTYWAEDANGKVYEANGCVSQTYTQDEPCGYCGDSLDPNDICVDCHNSQDHEGHTEHCGDYWDRGLDCPCIPAGVKDAIRNGANPEDVM